MDVVPAVAGAAGGGAALGGGEEQLGFRALFTIAANCPLLEVGVGRPQM